VENRESNNHKISGRVLKEYHSPINGILRLKKLDGKKILNTDHTNYSYGSLEDVLNYGLDFIPLEDIDSVLLLGMGAGCVIGSLKNRYNCHAPITAIEIDPLLIDIASKEFDIKPSKQLEIIQTDAYDYALKTFNSYDLVIIDIFIDLHVPKKFYSDAFWKAISKIITLNGFVLFNTGIDLTEKQVHEFLDRLPDCFLYQVMFHVYESNTLLILNKFHD